MRRAGRASALVIVVRQFCERHGHNVCLIRCGLEKTAGSMYVSIAGWVVFGYGENFPIGQYTCFFQVLRLA